MMIWGGLLTLAVFCVLTVAVILQVLPCIRKIRERAVRPTESRWPCVQVILSLKGTDPFLERCLERLAAQDYPDYQVTVVVDSLEDPAWQQASAAEEVYGREVMDLQVRSHQGRTCTRKLSNQLSAFSTLRPEVEIVVLCDGDAVVHRTWLKELVSGLDDSRLAAVSANRWFSPPGCDVASLSRHYWNALAIPTQQQHRILWAGSLAMRRSIVDESGFREAFEHGFADDAVIAAYLTRTGRPYEVLGTTYVVNSETTTIRGYWNFLVRQMLCVRLDHPRWRPIFLHAVVLAVAFALFLPALFVAGPMAMALGYLGLCIYGLTLLILTSVYDRELRRTFPEIEALDVPVSRQRVLMALPALLFTSAIYPAATIAAASTRSHLWRGVEYQLTDGKIVATIERPSGRERRGLTGRLLRRPGFLTRANGPGVSPRAEAASTETVG
ncbi:Glycosyl transferase family 2 [Caulifigura coniformis]|uniref:Glycosyl transferase family 2 n=1 Tax=Caulifigura coniformis TaxID=2527983 RepID=A0A517SE26_9PLAN|nr:glycosyltransferase family 2 protein [Caulifigura coniformis]QDT54373.1 Glycosyl transferase family 2 [Caulifigura coniformis]